ncbi:MAG: LptA/OstA family protein [Victivallaceae bacterium]|nr:LptA/OstA family protein [Victivallaceae bacterium]
MIMKIIILVFSFSLLNLVAQNNSDSMKNLKTFEARLPIYKDGRLQVFVYGREMKREGNIVDVKDPIIDIIRAGADIDSIIYIEKLAMYPLDTSLKDILLYWADISHSEGVISSTHATINSDAQIGYGSEKVFFRSPMLDLNGVGFHTDFVKRTLLVKNDVHIRIRSASVNPEKNDDKNTDQQMKAYGDNMFVDFGKEMVTLEGNVRIDDNKFTITCHRVELFFKDKTPAEVADQNIPKETKKPESNPLNDSLGGSLGGGNRTISKAICSGNVQVNKNLTEDELKKGAQHAKADEMVYDVEKSEIVLSGGEPVIYRGKDQLAAKEITIWRDNMRLQGRDDCEVTIQREDKEQKTLAPAVIKSDFMDMNLAENVGDFVGRVRLNDQEVKLDCDKMQLHFMDTEKVTVPQKTAPTDPDQGGLGGLGGFDGLGGGKQMSRILCTGNVIVISEGELNEQGEQKPEVRATAGRLDYDTLKSVVQLINDQPLIKRGSEYVSGDKITIWTKKQRMVVEHNAKLKKIADETVGEKKTDASNSVVTADHFDLDYGKGELLFTGRTKVRDQKLNLDCREMTIFMAEKHDTSSKKSKDNDQSAGMGSLDSFDVSTGGDKVNKVVCRDEVYIDDKKGELWSDLVTLMFEPKPPDAEKRLSDRGIAAFGKSELVRIMGDGNVRFVGKEQPKETNNANEKPGLLNPQTKLFADRSDMEFKKNYGFLDGNVKMINQDSGLQCEFMEFFLQDVEGEPPPRRPEDEEDVVSNRISLGHGKELKKVIAHRDVRLVRVTPKERMAATGNRAVYTVAREQMVLTGTPQKRATLRRNNIISEHDYVNYWPNKGLLSGGSGLVKEGGVDASE